MTHAYRQTMLSRLGFADPDKQEPDHDLACEYVAANAQALVELVARQLPEVGAPMCWDDGDHLFAVSGSLYVRNKCSVARERVISKGYGQYQTTVGFLDLAISYSIELKLIGKRRRGDRSSGYCEFKAIDLVKHTELWERNQHEEGGEWIVDTDMGHIGVEVKATPQNIGDIIRQMKLYQTYAGCKRWVLATCYPISSRQQQTLREENIQHICLGEKFQAWKQNANTTQAKMMEL